MNRRILLAGLVGLSVAAGCGAPLPSASPVPSATAKVPPAAAPTAFRVRGPIEWCGAWGGCAYFAELLGADQTWTAELEVDRKGEAFAIVGQPGLPSSLLTGPYALRLWQQPVSDAISNGVRQLGPVSGSCGTTFRVAPMQERLDIEVSFGFDYCEVAAVGD